MPGEAAWRRASAGLAGAGLPVPASRRGLAGASPRPGTERAGLLAPLRWGLGHDAASPGPGHAVVPGLAIQARPELGGPRTPSLLDHRPEGHSPRSSTGSHAGFCAGPDLQAGVRHDPGRLTRGPPGPAAGRHASAMTMPSPRRAP